VGKSYALFIVSSILIVGLVEQKITLKLKFVQRETTHGEDNSVRTSNCISTQWGPRAAARFAVTFRPALPVAVLFTFPLFGF
jgi:hypothetical protein